MEMRSFGQDEEGASLVGKNRSVEPPSAPTPPRSRLRCRHAVAGRRCGGSGWTLVWLVVLAIGVSVTLRNFAIKSRGIQGERFGSEFNALPSGSPRVAVCFYGLARSLRYTLPSARKRLLDVLEGGGARVDVFLHAYDAAAAVAATAAVDGSEEAGQREPSEHSGNYSDEIEKALNPTRVLVTSQDTLDSMWPNPIALTHYRWKYPDAQAPGIVRNVFRAYWSMATVWSLMELFALERGFQYDAVILARPDTWFHVDTDLPRRGFPLPEGTAFLPSFESDGGDGGRKNDLFAYGPPGAMKVLMNRVSTLLDTDAGDATGGELDAEGLLGSHLRANRISVTALEFPLSRVRANGEILAHDHPRVQEACDSGGDPSACEIIRLDFKIPTHEQDPGA